MLPIFYLKQAKDFHIVLFPFYSQQIRDFRQYPFHFFQFSRQPI